MARLVPLFTALDGIAPQRGCAYDGSSLSFVFCMLYDEGLVLGGAFVILVKHKLLVPPRRAHLTGLQNRTGQQTGHTQYTNTNAEGRKREGMGGESHSLVFSWLHADTPYPILYTNGISSTILFLILFGLHKMRNEQGLYFPTTTSLTFW